MPVDEAHLVRRAQKGDREAIAALYDCCYDSVFTYIYYRVSDQQCAEDLTTEVFVRMISVLPDYVDQGRPVLAWLYTIARNLVIDHYRSQKIEFMPLNDRLVGDGGKGPGRAERSARIPGAIGARNGKAHGRAAPGNPTEIYWRL